METKAFKQKQLKPGTETGSFINMMMSNNSTLPEVGKGATILSWTDRDAYEVISVSKDYKTVVIQDYIPERIDDFGMSDSQEYKYEKLGDNKQTIVWRHGAWRRKVSTIDFIDTYKYNKEDKEELFGDDISLKLVEGKTRIKTEYFRVNIVFGIRETYFDYSF